MVISYPVSEVRNVCLVIEKSTTSYGAFPTMTLSSSTSGLTMSSGDRTLGMSSSRCATSVPSVALRSASFGSSSRWLGQMPGLRESARAQLQCSASLQFPSHGPPVVPVLGEVGDAVLGDLKNKSTQQPQRSTCCCTHLSKSERADFPAEVR